MDEVLAEVSDDMALFKTDTDGCDISIVEQFLGHSASEQCPIFMEFDTSFELSPKEQVVAFLRQLEERKYSCAVFTNRGLPLYFQERLCGDTLLDISNYCIMQKNFKLKLEYLDLFLFPESKANLWDSIARSYRQRKVI